MAEDTNLKFCRHIDRNWYWTKKWKIGQRGKA